MTGWGADRTRSPLPQIIAINQRLSIDERVYSMKAKQYEVEVYESYSHGCYGKTHYFGWILSADKKEGAEAFALEILAGMTPNEIHKESDGKFIINCGLYRYIPVGDGKHRSVLIGKDEPLGYEEAERRFTVKARLFRG